MIFILCFFTPKEVSYARQCCIYIIKNRIQNEKLLQFQIGLTDFYMNAF